MIINIKGPEGPLHGTGNTFFRASCIRCVVQNLDTVITVYDEANNIIGDTTLLSDNEYFIVKGAADIIATSNTSTILATPVGFTIA